MSPDIQYFIANQFRALEEDEIQFLDSIRQRQEAEERQRKQEDGEELKQFKQYDSPFSALTSTHPSSRAVAARASSLNTPPPIPGSGKTSKPKVPPQPSRATTNKKSLKGVVVKKKTKLTPLSDETSNKSVIHSRDSPSEDLNPTPDAKRRKLSDVNS